MLVGDSADDGSRLRFEEFSNELNSMIEAKRLPFTIVLDDPAGNSYLQVRTT
jgi:C4-type Zn-finger protein